MQNQTQALAQSTGGAQPVALQFKQLTADKIDLLKRTVAKDTTDDELELFIHVCDRFGLDPFAKQIHCVKRFDGESGGQRMTIQTGIDGFRLIADRTTKTNGQQGPFWCGPDGKWVDAWLSDAPPAAAKVLVYKKGEEHPYTGIASFKSYCQKKKDGSPMKQWRVMPDVMIAKCAEALALRKAFPAELSGLYTHEEMAQADTEAAQQKPAASKAPPRKDPSPEEVFEMNKRAILNAKTIDGVPSKIQRGALMSDAQIKELRAIKAQRIEELQRPKTTIDVADETPAEQGAVSPSGDQPAPDPKVVQTNAETLYRRLARIDKGRADEIWNTAQNDQHAIELLDAELRAVDAEYKPQPKRLHQEDALAGT